MFCREALADLAVSRDSIEKAGAKIAVVHMAPPNGGRYFFKQMKVDDVSQFSDPGQELYKGFGVGRGSPLDLLNPLVWLQGLRALRYGGGLPEVDGFQMPGVFLVHKGRIWRAFLHETMGERPDYAALAEV